jgi:hypothetical protein
MMNDQCKKQQQQNKNNAVVCGDVVIGDGATRFALSRHKKQCSKKHTGTFKLGTLRP